MKSKKKIKQCLMKDSEASMMKHNLPSYFKQSAGAGPMKTK
jgi:hypothetical protein